jgi:hypothetical protein
MAVTMKSSGIYGTTSQKTAFLEMLEMFFSANYFTFFPQSVSTTRQYIFPL